MGKYSDLWNKINAENSNTASDSSIQAPSLPKLKWFNPNAAVKSTEKKMYMVRVLPLSTLDGWYFEFLKHSFKLNGQWKNHVCLSTQGKDGKPVGHCPVCEFLSQNADLLRDNQNVRSVKAKSNYALLVYDHVDKEIKRLEVNYYGFTDILEPICHKKDDGFEATIDKEGFNLYYELDENGYATVAGVNLGKKPLQALLESLGLNSVYPLDQYTLPFNPKAREKELTSLVDLMLNSGWFPEVGNGPKAQSRSAASAIELDEVEEEIELPSRQASKKTKTRTEVLEESEEDEAPKPAASKTLAKKPASQDDPEMSDEELDQLLDGFDV